MKIMVCLISMMKLVLKVLSLLTVALLPAYGQFDSLKYGAYLNSTEFNLNKPRYESEFIVTKKSQLGYYGYADSSLYPAAKLKIRPDLYLVTSTNPAIKNRTINKLIWGIYDNETFYLNARKIGMANGYIKIEELNRYSYFIGKPILSLRQEQMVNQAAFNYGMFGVLLSSLAIHSKNKNNIHYILNLKTGMIHLLTGKYVVWLLQPYNDLLEMYKSEKNNESLEVLLKYIELINSRFSS
jgi:hypothetical protein